MNEEGADDGLEYFQPKGHTETTEVSTEKSDTGSTRFSRSAEKNSMFNMHVDSRKNDHPKKTKLGSLIWDPATKGLQKSAFDLKETIKRPLTGLLRRPGSKAGKRVLKPDLSMKSVEVEQIVVPQNNFPILSAEEKTVISEKFENEKLSSFKNLEKYNGLESEPAVPVRLDAVNPKDAWMSKFEDIDLFLLSRFVCPEDEVKDETVPWSWDYLFACVSAELREEWALEDDQFDEKFDTLQS